MLGHLFWVVEDLPCGVRDRRVDRTLHRIGVDAVGCDIDKALGGEADETVPVEKLELRIDGAVDLPERERGEELGGEGEVEQIGVAAADLFDDAVEGVPVGREIDRLVSIRTRGGCSGALRRIDREPDIGGECGEGVDLVVLQRKIDHEKDRLSGASVSVECMSQRFVGSEVRFRQSIFPVLPSARRRRF